MPLYYPPTQNGLQKTLDAQLDQGVTASATLNNTTGLQNKPGVMLVDHIDTNGDEKLASVREFIPYTGVSGSTVTGLTRGAGGSTDQDHAVGAVVEFIPDVVWAQALSEALANLVDTTTLAVDTTKVVTPTGTQTLTNKTLASPTDTGTSTTPKQQGSASAATFTQHVGIKDLGTVGATETVNWANGDRQKMTLDENLTITFSNATEGQILTLFMLQDGSGTNTITFSNTIIWRNDSTPSWTTTAGKMNVASIAYVGGVYYGDGGPFA